MADTPFLLKPREVAKAVRKAMAEGRLGYQRGHEHCQYRYLDGACCAIGAALPDDLACYADGADDASVSALIVNSTFFVEQEEHTALLQHLQHTHDSLCGRSTTADRSFLRAVEACEAA